MREVICKIKFQIPKRCLAVAYASDDDVNWGSFNGSPLRYLSSTLYKVKDFSGTDTRPLFLIEGAEKRGIPGTPYVQW